MVYPLRLYCHIGIMLEVILRNFNDFIHWVNNEENQIFAIHLHFILLYCNILEFAVILVLWNSILFYMLVHMHIHSYTHSVKSFSLFKFSFIIIECFFWGFHMFSELSVSLLSSFGKHSPRYKTSCMVVFWIYVYLWICIQLWIFFNEVIVMHIWRF